MSDLLPPLGTPGVPPPPPALKRKRLWLSLLLPPIAMVFCMAGLIISSTLAGNSGEQAFTILCVIVCAVTIGCWVLYILTISERFRGSSLVLLILAFPVLQAILLFSVFFVGCWVAIWSEGIF